jgi:hypothetical protein
VSGFRHRNVIGSTADRAFTVTKIGDDTTVETNDVPAVKRVSGPAVRDATGVDRPGDGSERPAVLVLFADSPTSGPLVAVFR